MVLTSVALATGGVAWETVEVPALRSVAAAVKRGLQSGPAAGALALMTLFVVDLAGASIEVMGYSGDDRSYNLILHRYGARIVLGQLAILLTYATVGAGLGASGALVGAAWDRALRRTPSAARRMARGLGTALFGHAYFFARSMAHYPQLYSEAFFDRGGWRRAVMLAVTRLPLSAVDVLFATLLVAVVLAPAFAPAARARVREVALATAVRLRRWRPRRGVAIAAVFAALVAASAGLRAYHGHPSAQPNLLVLAVDSLRADRVFSPDAAARFPALAELAARGVRLREAHVTVPRTFPSFVTLLTGRWPYHHGIRHMFPTEAQRRAIGPALPSALRAAGYRTAVLSDYAGEIFSRTPMGFTDVDVPYFDMKTIVSQRGLQVHPHVLPYATSRWGRRLFPAVEGLPENADPALLADRAMDKLDKLSGAPFFVTVFFSAAHFPYAAPAPFHGRFADPRYEGPFRFQKPWLSTAPVGPADAAQIRALYDGAVASTDAAIARILRRLDDDGLAQNTIVVLLADHGENLYDVDGRGMGHGDHLRGSAADHVPLVVVDPVHRLAPRDVDAIVRDVDVTPTLAALAGVAPPPHDGVDLGPLLRGERETLELHAFAETELWFTPNGPGFEPDERLPYPGVTGVSDLAPDDDIVLKAEWQDMVVVAKHRSLRTRDWKLLYRPTRAGASWTLYDLKRDPAEEHDVAAAHPDVLAALRGELERWMTADGKTEMRGGFAVPR
jgi:arylsulfatase A-like enzyme